MKKKLLNLTVSPSNIQNSQKQLIKVTFVDEYFLKSIDFAKINFPQNIRQNYNIEIAQKQIVCYSKTDRRVFLRNDSKDIQNAFLGLTVYHVPHSKIEGNEQQLKKQINSLGNHDIIGYKYFRVAYERFEPGDYLFYARGPIKEFLSVIGTYMIQQKLQFSLDQYYQIWQIPLQYSKRITEIIIKQNISSITQTSKNDLNLIISSMSPKINQKDTRQRWPTSSIEIILSGDRSKIHQLYEIFQQKMSNSFIKVVQAQKEPFMLQSINSLPQVFPEYRNKIYKINQCAVALLDKQIDSEEVSRKLKLNTWIIDDQIFTKQQIRTLNSEHKNLSLKPHMNEKGIYWDSLQFFQFQIKITCDKTTKVKFVNQCTNLLKTFVKQRQVCRNFDDNFYIQIFRKYYLKNFQQKFSVQFEFGDKYLIRNNFTKYSDQIIEELKIVRQKIKKKMITFVSLFPIKRDINLNRNYFKQLSKPSGYAHRLLGCRLYQKGNIKIKMKPFESLKRQQQRMAYIIDDRLENQSEFYDIVKKNGINYETFLADAHKSKKPDRLRQYITEDCPYARMTVLLHAGRQKVTNTLRRDIEDLKSLLDCRLCITLFKHDQQFFDDVFKVVLDELSILASNNQIVQNRIGSIRRNQQNQTKPYFDLDIYYEGGQTSLRLIESVMRKSGVRIISSFSLQQFDIEKIYALQYHTMQVSFNNQVPLSISPIIAQLSNYELITKKRKRFVFSFFQKIEHQLVQFIISKKSRKYYKITHDEGNHGWSRLPHIQKIQDLEQELNQLLNVINNYFKYCDFIVFSAEAITDGLHGRTIKYCKQFYIAENNQQNDIQMVPISINIEDSKIHQCCTNNKIECTIKENKLKQWYEITTYKQELDTINSYL